MTLVDGESRVAFDETRHQNNDPFGKSVCRKAISDLTGGRALFLRENLREGDQGYSPEGYWDDEYVSDGTVFVRDPSIVYPPQVTIFRPDGMTFRADPEVKPKIEELDENGVLPRPKDWWRRPDSGICKKFNHATNTFTDLPWWQPFLYPELNYPRRKLKSVADYFFLIDPMLRYLFYCSWSVLHSSDLGVTSSNSLNPNPEVFVKVHYTRGRFAERVNGVWRHIEPAI